MIISAHAPGLNKLTAPRVNDRIRAGAGPLVDGAFRIVALDDS